MLVVPEVNEQTLFFSRTWLRLCLAPCVIGMALSSPLAAAERPKSQDLTDFFTDVVFGAEYKEFAQGSEVVKKWVDPIRISVSSMKGEVRKKPDGSDDLKLEHQRPPAYPVQMIQKHLKTLVKLTGVVVEDAKKVGKSPNFFIKIVPRLAMHAPFLVPKADPKLLRRLAGPGVCYFLTAAIKGEIVWATVVVNGELNKARIEACLLEEMTQALGLPNDSDLVQPSIFNQRSTRQSLSRSDIILIASLYDEKLTAGMAVKKAIPIAAGIISHLNAAFE